MKLHKVLTIGGTVYPLVKDDVRLDSKSPGRATFTIQAGATVKGLVTLDIGYNENPLQRHFIGYVERSTAANSLQQILVCRELAAILANPLPLNLRHVDLQAVLAEIGAKTGLRFRVPDQPYTRVKAPYFYSLAAGYLAMDSLARVFNIPDCIWQQQGDGELFVGSWADSFFGARAPLQLPVELFEGYQGNQSAMIAVLPGLRPGATINQGERITSVTLAGNQMDDAIRRSVERQFPELSGGYHLPRFGRVVAVPDAPAAPGLCDDFRPRFGVDVEVLTADGEPDPDLPILTGLPLPAPMGGQEAGMYGFPEEGTTVVVSFAYGLPHKPFITQILPHGLSLPRVPKGDQVWQHSEACQQRVDADGNWLRQTDGKIKDKAIERTVEALENSERFQNHTRTVDDHSTESVGGIKKIEALGALKLLSGGSASLAAVDDLHQATGRDLNLVVGQKHNATVGGDMQEQIQGMRESLAGVSQRLVAPKTWLGSEGVNVLQVLCDLLDLVQQMNIQLASHTHGPTPVPSNSAIFTESAKTASVMKEEMNLVTL